MERKIGGFVVGETIGQGSFAKVKVGVHESTKQRVALKFVSRKRIQLDANFELKIKREVRILRLLNHPHIMRLYDVITTKTEIVLVTEYCGGGELFDFQKEGRVSEAQARTFFQQLISGVDYCHSFNIAHRDLKPDNLLLDDRRRNIKIADFGFLGSCGTVSSLTPAAALLIMQHRK